MRKPRHPARAILCALAAALTLRAADAAQFGALVGLVRDATGAPVAEATVTAVRADGSATRATLTGSDGVYSFADLPPGAWSVSVELVDHRSVSRAALAVLAGQATRADLAVAAPAGAQLAAAPAPAAAPVRAAPQLPEALQAPEPGAGRRHADAVRGRRPRLDERHRPRQRRRSSTPSSSRPRCAST